MLYYAARTVVRAVVKLKNGPGHGLRRGLRRPQTHKSINRKISSGEPYPELRLLNNPPVKAISLYMATLSVINITKNFGDTRVLSDISIDVRSGEFFSLLGPSGCGKSTLLRIIAGLETADSGRIEVNNKKVDGIPPQKRGIGMVFQQYALWPHMTIAQNVRFGLESLALTNQERDNKMNSSLERVQMLQYKDRYPHQISGGQQQRVALARALAIEPSIILLDEPLSNLDARLRAEIRQELSELHAKLGTTMIYVTHDQEDALSLSSRIAIMNKGAIEQVGTPREIYSSPASPFCALFIGEANLLPCKVLEVFESGETQVQLASPLQNIVNTKLAAPTDQSHRDGFLCLRPTALKVEAISSVQNGSQYSLEARLIRATYRGPDYDLELLASGAVKMKATCLTSQFAASLTAGSEVKIVWDHRDSVFVANRSYQTGN